MGVMKKVYTRKMVCIFFPIIQKKKKKNKYASEKVLYKTILSEHMDAFLYSHPESVVRVRVRVMNLSIVPRKRKTVSNDQESDDNKKKKKKEKSSGKRRRIETSRPEIEKTREIMQSAFVDKDASKPISRALKKLDKRFSHDRVKWIDFLRDFRILMYSNKKMRKAFLRGKLSVRKLLGIFEKVMRTRLNFYRTRGFCLEWTRFDKPLAKSYPSLQSIETRNPCPDYTRPRYVVRNAKRTMSITTNYRRGAPTRA